MTGLMNVRVTTLDNGLRVVTDRMDTVETVSVGAWVDTGARHEAPHVNGVSHLLEHMAFKGTKRRSARQIAEEIEDVGGHVNAYTSREHTAYYAKMLKEDLPLAVDIIADILQHSVLDPTEFERERSVILQEIHQAHDTPDDIVFDFFQETAYPDQPIGLPVLGTLERVGSMDRETAFDYMRAHYSAPAIVISAAGNVDHDTFVAMVETAFGDLPPHRRHEMAPAAYRGGDFRRDRELEQVHVLLGLDGVGYLEEDFHAASVYTALIGGGMSSRLFQQVREERGLVYTIYSFLSSYTDGGVFGVYAGTGEAEVEELMAVVCEELQKAAETVTEAETDRARAQLKASIMMGLESTSARCEQAARHLLIYGRPVPVEETVEKLEAVDADAVRRVAKRLVETPLTVTALGPVGRLEGYDTTAARLG